MANFKIHARVLDLLGEDQIADCPTAISELFKNAYDAYANKVLLDAYLDDDLALLWDDGVGMSEADILSRWLVVGTPGKKAESVFVNASARSVSALTPPTHAEVRPVMGEKGIGRLAISTLGDTLLLVSRQERESGSFSALLINWNIVRNDRLLLSDIEVPVITFDTISDLETGIVKDMVTSFLAPIIAEENDALWDGPYEHVRKKIVDQLSAFDVDLTKLLKTGIDRRKSGSVFYIANLIPDLSLYLASPDPTLTINDSPQALLIQLLCEFRKVSREREAKLVESVEILAEEKTEIDFFADVRKFVEKESGFRSVFSDWSTFDDDALALSDHYFRFDFDKDGRYSGFVRRYDEVIDVPYDATLPSLGVSCGPFSLEFWYWQGKEQETKLTPEQKLLIDGKLGLCGGLLLYRDDLRVLPYGRPEFDWLKIEERRSGHAGRNFFSYRRMFGTVSISREKNPNLRDKTGREGLKSNKEYRDFKKVLINFLTAISKSHFGGSEEFMMKKGEVQKQQELLNKHQNRAEEKRKKLLKDLTDRLQKITAGEEEIERILEKSLSAIDKLPNSAGDEKIIDANIDFEDRLHRIEESARFTIPSNISLGRKGKLLEVHYDYLDAWPKFRARCTAARLEFAAAVKLKRPNIETASLRKRALENLLFKARTRVGKAHADIRQEVDETETAAAQKLTELKRQHLDQLERLMLIETESKSLDEAFSSPFGDLAKIGTQMNGLVADLSAEAASYGSRLSEAITDFLDRETDVLIAVQTDEIEELREDVQKHIELIQLGLSVEIIDHDLQKTYRGIKNNLARLMRLLQQAPKSLAILKDLSATFQHLEQRYQLMSPLYRKSYQVRSEFTGERIFEYVSEFLGQELQVHDITLLATESFKRLSIYESPGRILPAFINVIDNAIYWTRDAKERKVVLDFYDGVVTINDTGVGIHPSRLKKLFKAFESGKPSGRGLGLFIARANLEVGGHQIWAENTTSPLSTHTGACFCIRFHAESIRNGGK